MDKNTGTFEAVTDAKGNSFELRPWHCPICGQSAEKTMGLRGGKHHRYGLGVVNQIVQCSVCSLLYPNPFPVPRDAQKLYGDPAKYFFRHDEQRKIGRGRDLVREFGRRLGRKSFTLLDVGSGRGEILQAAKLEGVNAIGLEFSDAMIEHTAKTYGITPFDQSIEAYADDKPGTIDAFCLNAILEHVYDPDSMIAAAAKLAAPGAVMYLDLPHEPNIVTTVGNLANRMTGNPAVYNLSPSWPPYHVYGFNQKALGTLLRKHGFSITKMVFWAQPLIPAKPQLADRLKCFVAAQIMKVGNLTGTATNMLVWAKRES